MNELPGDVKFSCTFHFRFIGTSPDAAPRARAAGLPL